MVEEEKIEGEAGAENDVDAGADVAEQDAPATDAAEPTAEDLDEVEADEVPESDVESANYKITGLVDIFDEQMNITGQYPIGSVQNLPVEVGMAAVANGTAEALGETEGEPVEDEVE